MCIHDDALYKLTTFTFAFIIILSDNSALCVCVLQRLQTKVIKIVDVSYGGENGFNQAIELASEALGNVKFIQEKKLIGLLGFLVHIS